MPTVRFKPQDKVVEAKKASTILETALDHNIPLHHTCGGNASCSTCRVKILNGAQNLSPIESAEAQILDSFDLKPPYRLSCQAMIINGDIEVEIPDRDKEPRPNKTPKLSEGPRGTY